MIPKCTYICTVLHYHSCSPSNIQGWHEQQTDWCPHLRLVAELLWSTGWDVEWFWSYVCYFSTLFQLPYLSFNISSLWNRLDTWNVQFFFEESKPLLTDFWTIFSPSVSDWSSECEGSVPEDFGSETPGPHLANQREASLNKLRKNMELLWVSSKRPWWKMLKGVTCGSISDAIVASNWWRFTSLRTINVHAMSWDQAPNGGACRKGMQYPSECLKGCSFLVALGSWCVHVSKREWSRSQWFLGRCYYWNLRWTIAKQKQPRSPSFWELPSTRAIS